MNDIKEIKDLKEWQDFVEYCNDKSFIDQLGLFRYEDMHTNYLASLLKEKNVYGYGLKPMKCFLNLINEKNKTYFSKINFEEEYTIKDLVVDVRKPLKHGIPDLYITFRLIQNDINLSCLILLEAKLESDEHNDQCSEYYDDVKDFPDSINKVFLYLTLDGRKCSAGDKYESITYQDLIDYIYAPLKDLQANVVLTIEEYLKSFNALYDFDYPSFKNYPLTPKMKELVEALWNKQVIKDLWCEDLWKNMYKEYPKQFKIFSICLINSTIIEDISIVEKIKQSIKRIKDIYIFKGEIVPMVRLAYHVFYELIYNNNYNVRKLEDIDKRLLETTKGYMNLVSEEGIKFVPNQDYYSKTYQTHKCLEINNVKYYYLRFNPNDANNFIRTLRECYSDLSHELIIEKKID